MTTSSTTGPDPDRFRDEVSSFLLDAVADGTACPAYGAIVPPGRARAAIAWQRHCHDNGFAGIHWPTRYGGRGLSRAHSAVWYEECARVAVAPYLNLQGIILAAEAILRAGTEQQKQDLLARTLRAEIVWCQLFSEPGAGSDLAGLGTSAVRVDDRFVVNGQKVWSSNAELAHYGILLARTDPEAPAHRGLSFFCYDMSLPGTEVRPLRQMTGDAEFSEVFFTDAAVPADALVGGLNEGWQVAMEVLTDERGSFGSAGAISLRRRVDELRADLAGRGARPDGTDLRLLTRSWALACLLERSAGDPTMASVAKLGRSELEYALAVADLDGRGAAGMVDDGATTGRFLYAPGMRIAGGSSEIQRSLIGERLLCLPRYPRRSR